MPGQSFANLTVQSVTRRWSSLNLEFKYRRIADSEIKVHEYIVGCCIRVHVTVECYKHKDRFQEQTVLCCHKLRDNDVDALVYNTSVISDKLNLHIFLGTNKVLIRRELPETFDLTFEVRATTSFNAISTFQSNLIINDFELVADDGPVRISKLLLAAYSPVFASMFSGDNTMNSEGRVKGTTSATLHNLKNYMFRQTLPDEGLLDLLLLATAYRIPDLQQNCVFQLTRELTPKASFDLMAFAGNHDLKVLVVAVMEVSDLDEMKSYVFSSDNHKEWLHCAADRTVMASLNGNNFLSY